MPDDVNPIPVEVLRALVRKEGVWKPDAANALADLAAYALALRECLRVIVDGHDPYEEGGCIDLTRARALLGED